MTPGPSIDGGVCTDFHDLVRDDQGDVQRFAAAQVEEKRVPVHE